jgi:hypothetical protein
MTQETSVQLFKVSSPLGRKMLIVIKREERRERATGLERATSGATSGRSELIEEVLVWCTIGALYVANEVISAQMKAS